MTNDPKRISGPILDLLCQHSDKFSAVATVYTGINFARKWQWLRSFLPQSMGKIPCKQKKNRKSCGALVYGNESAEKR
ncbi:MAG: hypothetical protein HN916_15650 [Anaerolineae bacterium]|jgi:hypothetical protein|nr:hypothetical protein [Anaerolineae bacterium]